MVKCSMDENGRDGAVVGPVVSEGGRSPSTLSPGHAAPLMQSGAKLARLAPGQRWSATRKREVVLRLLRGESAELLSRELGLPIVKLGQWRRKADAALEGALKEREGNPAGGELAAAMRRIGELSMEVGLLRSRIERPGPLGRGRSRRWRRQPPPPPAANTASPASAGSGTCRAPPSPPPVSRRRTAP